VNDSVDKLQAAVEQLRVASRSSSAYESGPMKVVGKSAHRLDGVEKATGDIKYGQDLFDKKFLSARVLRAAYPHAEIVSIDTREARKLPGVLAVITHKDVPGTNMHGLIRRDQEVLCSRKVRYLGDAVAVVVARTEEIATAALDKIKVDYKPLPLVLTMEDALKPDAPKIHAEGNVLGEKHLRKGDAPKAMGEADVVVEDIIQTQTVDHAFLDLEAGRARFDGKMLTIEVAGQWLHEERRLIALAIGLPLEKLRIIQPATGGAFGGREDISIQIYLGLAALRLKGRTVCMRYSRSESMIARHKRHPIRVHYKLGAKKDGTLVAAQVTFYVDKGAYASTGIAVMRKASSHATGPYKVPNVWVDVIGVFTNNNPCGAMRGFGAAQTAIAYEGLMDRLAAKLGMDKAELRLKNMIHSGDEVTTGQTVPHATGVECFQRRAGEDRLEKPQLRDRRAAPQARLRHQCDLFRPRLRGRVSRCVARAVPAGARRHGRGVLQRDRRRPGADQHDRPDRRRGDRRAAGAGADHNGRHGTHPGIRQHVGDTPDVFHGFVGATGGVGTQEAAPGHCRRPSRRVGVRDQD
jgi:nicotinate dehydrogenase large molybdopterin subunit